MLTYGTLVKVIVGFYMGCSGYVTDRIMEGEQVAEYYVEELTCQNDTNSPSHHFRPSELEVIKKKVK